MTTSASPPAPTVTAAAGEEFALLERLLQLYLHDVSEHAGYDVDEAGSYRYAWLGAYRHDADRHAFILRVEGHPAGFALVRAGEPTRMAEFFVLRKYRRGGVGTLAARDLIAMFPGTWSITQLATNRDATEFWRRAIPASFDECVHADGGVEQTFSTAPPKHG
ncbi:hypothetical protein BH708_12765 [Brachybacterium sp. P6-10-X1]|uniref:GNAT family N-acetyltransferase n=1 Tax=Brachybacterium sp. P6-10-X1 TaxID=1903186 RepID=UPI0009717624|nr:GNAT family N-acetyltransferase [Brachybacterium sp. P6-10-X1]APX33444.1 hypothetical protein BH708_12765 [Brachybacterium sp. P6-10-X1]